VTPFDQARGRQHNAAASLLVILAAQLLKWQNPATACGELLKSLALTAREFFASEQAPLPSH
jgi:hypothetical protein